MPGEQSPREVSRTRRNQERAVPQDRCHICEVRLPTGTRHTVLWGWIAVLYCEMGGPWYPPTEAAKVAGVSTAALRDWAQHGLITSFGCPGRQRRYYLPELRVVADLVQALEIAGSAGRKGRKLLAEHVDVGFPGR